jgi:hypothetical protein
VLVLYVGIHILFSSVALRSVVPAPPLTLLAVAF